LEESMATVIAGLSVRLDGFIAEPNDGPTYPLDEGGDRLFRWTSCGQEANIQSTR
jgi:hypothetical protein